MCLTVLLQTTLRGCRTLCFHAWARMRQSKHGLLSSSSSATFSCFCGTLRRQWTCQNNSQGLTSQRHAYQITEAPHLATSLRARPPGVWAPHPISNTVPSCSPDEPYGFVTLSFQSLARPRELRLTGKPWGNWTASSTKKQSNLVCSSFRVIYSCNCWNKRADVLMVPTMSTHMGTVFGITWKSWC